MIAGMILIALAILGIGAFAGYPLFVILKASMSRAFGPPSGPIPSLSVSFVIVVRNGKELLREKLANLAELHFPADYEVRICSDGSTDGTDTFIQNLNEPNIFVKHFPQQQGKNACLSAVLPECLGDVVIFTDADALLNPEAVQRLLHHFSDPQVGGVCGQRLIRAKDGSMVAPQQGYIGMDSWIKSQESRFGSITSNDGKLYAVRRELVRHVPGPVTDDLWQAMGVVLQGRRFVFEPGAMAYIRTPSRSLAHEISRRRRVVSRGVNGIWLSRSVLNPLRTGFYGIGLFINKVDRRLQPFWLLSFLVGTGLVGFTLMPFAILFVLQLLGYAGLFLYNILHLDRYMPRKLVKVADSASYFAAGNLGMGLGFIDFLFGRAPSKWEPKKSDT